MLGRKSCHLIDSVPRSKHFSICKQRSLATASCFLRNTLTVLIQLCTKNWRPAQIAGGPEPTEIPHIWCLTLPAPQQRLRTLWWSCSLGGSWASQGCTSHHLLQLFTWGWGKRNVEGKAPCVSRNSLAQAAEKQIYWLRCQCRIWKSWVHIQALLLTLKRPDQSGQVGRGISGY